MAKRKSVEHRVQSRIFKEFSILFSAQSGAPTSGFFNVGDTESGGSRGPTFRGLKDPQQQSPQIEHQPREVPLE